MNASGAFATATSGLIAAEQAQMAAIMQAATIAIASMGLA